MTLSPTDNRNVKGIEHTGPYEVNPICAHPACNRPKETGGHHLWRRSALGGPFWWVELEDGTVLPNVVGLCPEHHRQVTENKVRITYDADTGFFHWQKSRPGVGLMFGSLNPQPGPRAVVHDGKSFDRQLTIDGREVPHEVVCAANEEPCPTCKGRGKRPKREHKLAPPRKKAVVSIRVPKAAREGDEDGAEILSSLIDGCRSRLANDLGWSLEGDASYYVLTAVLHDWLTT